MKQIFIDENPTQRRKDAKGAEKSILKKDLLCVLYIVEPLRRVFNGLLDWKKYESYQKLFR